MARKRREEAPSGGNAPWLNTFADLMNLLLCFFVMLFAYSDVNQEKFEKISISFSNSFGLFDGGGASMGEGELISSGMTQLSELDQYFTNVGRSSSRAGINTDGQADTSDLINAQNGNPGTQDSPNPEEVTGSASTDMTVGNEEIGLDAALEKINAEMAKANEDMYDQISDLTGQYNLKNDIELSIDPDNKYVQLTLKGSVLYDSGEADIRKTALPVLDKIGNILNKFKGYRFEITGHTDNVPMTSNKFKDNNWLSSARALNAAEYLIRECGIDPSALKYSGRGEYEPISSNATSEGRANNRRIEIKIYNEYSTN